MRQDININKVRGIHTNWRVAVYYPGKIIKTYVKRKQEWIKENDPGNAFPAHYDLSDTVRVDAEEEGAIEVIEGWIAMPIYFYPTPHSGRVHYQTGR